MSSTNEDETTKVVMRQTLMSVSEVFVYRIPPLKTVGGHRAEDWDLANPLKECSLFVERKDHLCCVRLMSHVAKVGGPAGATRAQLFAESIMDLSGGQPLLYFCEGVVDSSRYFAIRIIDEKRDKSALIGLGFRERDDASNFRMALQDWERSLAREKQAAEIHDAFEEQTGAEPASEDQQLAAATTSKLTLKEGEKIHINLKGHGGSAPRKAKSAGGSSGAPILLSKPPPPAGTEHTMDLDISALKTPKKVAGNTDVDSSDAVADEDEDWDDFQGAS